MVQDYQMSAEELKAALLDSFWGTDRGLAASTESRADINELITQLEAKSPCTNPTEAMELLGGTWRLVYTSNSDVIALLSLSKLPLVSIQDITQSIEPLSATVVNSLVISAPFSSTAISTTAAVTVQSPKRLNLRFEKGTISTPELMTDANLPDSTMVLGQNVDLRPLKSALEPVKEASRDLVMRVSEFISKQPNLDIPISSKRAETWLLTTYLDESLRISRGDAGSIFVLTKETPAPPPAAYADMSSTQQFAADTGAMPSRPPDPDEVARGMSAAVQDSAGSAVRDASDAMDDAVQRFADTGEMAAAEMQEVADNPAQAARNASSAANNAVQGAVDDAEKGMDSGKNGQGKGKGSSYGKGKGRPST